MRKYVLIVTLLISCVRSQSKKVSNDKNINIVKIDSTEIERGSIPPKYVVKIPLEINKKKMDIRLALSRSEHLSREKNYTIAEIEENTNSFLPKSAYECIEGTIELQHWIAINNNSYDYTYDYYKNKGFKEDDFVKKKKIIFGHGDYSFITITDVDNDGYEDLLILDLAHSMRDNEVYQFYKWSEKQSKFIFMPDFFDKAAFYGWDKTAKYLITGVSDTRERKLYKNKIVQGKLKIVDKCTEYAVSDKFCW